MRLHSDVLRYADITQATHNLPGVYVQVTEHGSRSHARAFEVRLEGNGYARNTGQYGADSAEQAATWDEWGVFFARLYWIDPLMVAGSVKYPTYRNGGHYHAVTGSRFAGRELPEDTHKRHTWEPTGETGRNRCKRCTATLNRD